MRILFLDFDGVLSPGSSGTLRHAADLARLLEPYPDVRVVLSTNWRETEPLQHLKDGLDPALAERVIDATPVLPGNREPGGRQREIEAWLSQHPASSWLALDDMPDLYQPNCPWLFATAPRDALDPPAQQRLTLRLARVFGPGLA